MTLTSPEENRIAMNTEPPNILHIYARVHSLPPTFNYPPRTH